MVWMKGNAIMPQKKPIKIMAFGNSFSTDALEYLYDIATSAGIDITVGNMFLSGQTLQDHWNNAQNNVLYNYTKWEQGQGFKKETTKTALQGISDDDWDVITYQNRSTYSGMYEYFQPYLNDLISYARRNAIKPDLKIGLHMTWANSSDSTHSGFPNYDSDQMTMYNAIVGAHLQAFEGSDLDLLIPAGTAIQNARTNEYLNDISRELTRDGYHLDQEIGRYIAGLTWFESLMAGKFKKDIYHDVTFIPNRIDSTRFLACLSKVAVKNAVINPFKITDI